MDLHDFIRPKGPLDKIVTREIERRKEAARIAACEQVKIEPASEPDAKPIGAVKPKRRKRAKAITTLKIKYAVCEHYDIRMIDFLSKRRTARIVLPRQIGMHLSRVHTTTSYPKIARAFGRSDHTTALYADRKVAALRETDQQVAQHIREIEDALGIRRLEEDALADGRGELQVDGRAAGDDEADDRRSIQCERDGGETKRGV